MILKTVLFYFLYVQLGGVIYPALVGHSLPSKWEIFCRKPLSKTCKIECKHQAIFFFVLLLSTNDTWMCSCILSSWENVIPRNMLFILGGRLVNSTRGRYVLKRAESHSCEANTLWKLACNFCTFLKVSGREFLWKIAYRI